MDLSSSGQLCEMVRCRAEWREALKLVSGVGCNLPWQLHHKVFFYLSCGAMLPTVSHFIPISLVKQTDFFIYFSGPDFTMEYQSYPLRWCVFILDHKLHSCFYKGKPADCRTKFWSKLGKFLLKCTKPYKKGVV